jgi:hypothetical protein
MQKLCYDSDTFVMPLNDYYTANKRSTMIAFTEHFMNKPKNTKSFKLVSKKNQGSYMSNKGPISMGNSSRSKNDSKLSMVNDLQNDKYVIPSS